MLISQLFRVPKQTLFSVRHGSIWREYKKMNEQANWEGGEKFKGFTYYPKPGEVDPPYEPSKVFMVQRTADWRGTEYWCKKILFDFKLDKAFKKGKISIIKNTPDNNERLWKIKHLVKITPVTFPNGEPKEGDEYSTHLNFKGELEIKKSINCETNKKEVIDMKANTLLFKKKELKKHSLKVWEQGWKSPWDQ